MPTILKFQGLRVVIYPNDHRPAHVHVVGRGMEAVFQLHCTKGEPELRENYRFSKSELILILKTVTECQEILCLKWRQIHGDYN